MIFQETVWVGMESCDSRKETVGKKITWGIHAISWVYRCIGVSVEFHNHPTTKNHELMIDGTAVRCIEAGFAKSETF